MNVQIIEDHIIGKLGSRPVRELSDSELQRFVNGYVEQNASRVLPRYARMADTSRWRLEGQF